MSSAEDQVAQYIRREEECNTKGMAQGQHETYLHTESIWNNYVYPKSLILIFASPRK